jgi:predicted lipoprotein
MRTRRAEIVPGSVWRQVALGSEAIYKVLAVDGDHVDVSVRTGPGMRPGTRVRLTVDAVRAMVRVDDGDGGNLRGLPTA